MQDGPTAADIQRLRSDLDLGVLMADRLAARGETGAAVHLVEHLRDEAAQTLHVPSPERRRVPRITALGAGIATAVGIGLSAAAALVLPTADVVPDRSERPVAEITRAPEANAPVMIPSGSAPSQVPFTVTPPGTEAPVDTVAPADEPRDGLWPPPAPRPEPPSVEPPDKLPGVPDDTGVRAPTLPDDDFATP